MPQRKLLTEQGLAAALRAALPGPDVTAKIVHTTSASAAVTRLPRRAAAAHGTSPVSIAQDSSPPCTVSRIILAQGSMWLCEKRKR